MRNSYLLAGIRTGKLLKLLSRNKVSFSPAHILRIAFLLQSSTWSSVFAGIENLRYSKAIRSQQPPVDPVFIIGHWRTGSTLLHQLFHLDPQIITPTLFQVAIPDSFLSTYHYYKPVFRTLVSEHRPMDMVKIGMNEPQEDEYAILRLTCRSPLERLIFPVSANYFLEPGMEYGPAPADAGKWKEIMLNYFKKLRFGNDRTIVSKNPFNSFRIRILCEMFPGARFIHIVRNPLDVVPSTVHMWEIVQKQNCLTGFASRPRIGEVTAVLADLLATIERDQHYIKPGNFATVKFEDLEADPETVMDSLYNQFNLRVPTDFNARINDFVTANEGFRKNIFELPEQDKVYIRSKLEVFMEKYHY